MATADELFQPGGIVAHQTGDLDAAERGYRQLLDAVPDHAAALTNLASVVARRGETDEAEQLYRRAIAANPGALDARFNLGNLYRRLKRPREAAAEFEAVLRGSPRPRSAGAAGQPRVGGGRCRQLAACGGVLLPAPPPSPRTSRTSARLRSATRLARLGRDEAVLAFREFVTRFPAAPARAPTTSASTSPLTGHPSTRDAISPRCDSSGRSTLNPDYAEAHNAAGHVAAGQPSAAPMTLHQPREYREAVRMRSGLPRSVGTFEPGHQPSSSTEARCAEAIDVLRCRRALGASATARTRSCTARCSRTCCCSADLVSAEQLRDQHIAWAEDSTPTPSHPAASRPRMPRPSAPGRGASASATCSGSSARTPRPGSSKRCSRTTTARSSTSPRMPCRRVRQDEGVRSACTGFADAW